ncbi:MAG: hypothetical protein IKB64_07040, partial [Paludibacteraceae bacterium]|nr:hypothetical protein [Paludibacteraceae bacterium]
MRKFVLHIMILFLGVETACGQNPVDIRLLHSILVGEYNGVNTVLVCDLVGDGLPEMATVQSDYRDNEGRIVIM